ncbi:MAG TPA: SDR family NAD(P)-dependent oxidoreductase, partial [Usitatibacter sp.]
GYDLIVAADGDMVRVADHLALSGVGVEALQVELSTEEGVDELLGLIGNREVDALLANAGHGLGGAFLDQDWDEARDVIDTNITGTAYLVQQLARRMVERGEGRILITGSIAGFTPGSFQAVYNGTKAFIDSFSWALRNELKDMGVTVTCLMPGATDTNFFERARMLDTRIAQGKKDDAADVARVGFEAMMQGKGDVISGAMNRVDAALAHITPSSVLAEVHRRGAEPLGPQ